MVKTIQPAVNEMGSKRTLLPDEINKSFFGYAVEVISGRAIPDARDGLKPVQRRILWAMFQAGHGSSTKPAKSGEIVGDVMGRYHPHGDSAIYETLVKMASPHLQMLPMIQPRGNFGDLDDPPAAMRYTEARLTAAAETLLLGVKENATEMVETYTGARTEPVVLPAPLPVLLTNGSQGIGVGLVCSILPHCLAEVIAAVEANLRKGDSLTVAETMRHIKAPDFPSGGVITSSRQQIKSMYATGTGKIDIQAKVEIGKEKQRPALEFSQFPYNVGVSEILATINKAQDSDKLKFVAETEDLTDSDGARLRLVLRGGTDPQAAADELFRATRLAVSLTWKAVALVGDQVAQHSLPELIQIYSDHLLDTTRRRSEFLRDAALKRAHRLRALYAAVQQADQVVATIRSSANAAATRDALKRMLGLDDEQAEAVREMRLGRLDQDSAETIAADLAAAEAEAELHDDIATNQRSLDNAAIASLNAAAAPFISKRRSTISPAADN